MELMLSRCFMVKTKQLICIPKICVFFFCLFFFQILCTSFVCDIYFMYGFLYSESDPSTVALY